MAKISLREAVKHFDVSRPTLQKALKNGKISGSQDGQGHWIIDPSELARVYQPRSSQPPEASKPPPDGGKVALTTEVKETYPADEIIQLKTKLLEAEKRAELAEALAHEREKHIEDLRRMLPAPDRARRKWWPWS